MYDDASNHLALVLFRQHFLMRKMTYVRGKIWVWTLIRIKAGRKEDWANNGNMKHHLLGFSRTWANGVTVRNKYVGKTD